MSAISNTTVISNFAGIEQLHLLQRLFGLLYISFEVYEEIQDGLEEGYEFYAPLEQIIFPLTESGWIHLTSMTEESEFRTFLDLPSRLHKGETSSLAIAHHRKWLFLSDDLEARKMATRLGIRLSGSLGCLVLAIEHQLCSAEQANRWLEGMIRQGYHSPMSTLDSLL